MYLLTRYEHSKSSIPARTHALPSASQRCACQYSVTLCCVVSRRSKYTGNRERNVLNSLNMQDISLLARPRIRPQILLKIVLFPLRQVHSIHYVDIQNFCSPTFILSIYSRSPKPETRFSNDLLICYHKTSLMLHATAELYSISYYQPNTSFINMSSG